METIDLEDLKRNLDVINYGRQRYQLLTRLILLGRNKCVLELTSGEEDDPLFGVDTYFDLERGVAHIFKYGSQTLCSGTQFIHIHFECVSPNFVSEKYGYYEAPAVLVWINRIIPTIFQKMCDSDSYYRDEFSAMMKEGKN